MDYDFAAAVIDHAADDRCAVQDLLIWRFALELPEGKFKRLVKRGWLTVSGGENSVTPAGLAVIERAIAAASQPPAGSVPNVEAMLAACVPGGSSCDPQAVADNIREWWAAHSAPRPPSGASPTLDASMRSHGLPKVADALGYSRNFAAANPNLTQTAKDHILGLCDMLELAAAQPTARADGLHACIEWDGLSINRDNPEWGACRCPGFGGGHVRHAPESSATHECRNCMGAQPETCLLNPDRTRAAPEAPEGEAVKWEVRHRFHDGAPWGTWESFDSRAARDKSLVRFEGSDWQHECRELYTRPAAPEGCPRCGATSDAEAESKCQPSGDDCPGVALFNAPEAGDVEALAEDWLASTARKVGAHGVTAEQENLMRLGFIAGARRLASAPRGGEECLPDYLDRIAGELLARDNHPGTFAEGIAESLRGRAYLLRRSDAGKGGA